VVRVVSPIVGRRVHPHQLRHTFASSALGGGATLPEVQKALSARDPPGLPVTAVTVAVIEDFIEAKRLPGGSIRFKGKPLSDASLRTGLLTLRLILQRAVRTKRTPANPMHEVEWRGCLG
jgi:hypothetical protein